ncbi:MAG: hypothetical protein R3B97_09075 [Dehalococcoidia bacterium]
MTVETDLTIEFQRFTPGADLLGATQANFSIDRPGIHAKELSILLNNPAAAYIAEIVGRENTPAFREEAARIAGKAWLRRLSMQVSTPTRSSSSPAPRSMVRRILSRR